MVPLGGIAMKHNNEYNKHNPQLFEYDRQAKNIITNQEILQQKQLTEHRKAALHNNDFSCMLKK